MKFLGVCALCWIGSNSFGAMITVPNANFSSSSNNGSIQGNLISGGQTANPMGSGPWSASTTAFAGILIPPQATIGSGSASVSSLLGLGVLGQSNSARFYQTLTGTNFLPNTIYTLSATIDAAAALDPTILIQNGLGIALTAGSVSNVVASSTGGGASLSLLSGTRYRLEIQHTIIASIPSGNLGLKLYVGENASLATVNLLGSVAFDDVSLDATAIPEPPTIVLVAAGAILCMGARSQKRVAT